MIPRHRTTGGWPLSASHPTPITEGRGPQACSTQLRENAAYHKAPPYQARAGPQTTERPNQTTPYQEKPRHPGDKGPGGPPPTWPKQRATNHQEPAPETMPKAGHACGPPGKVPATGPINRYPPPRLKRQCGACLATTRARCPQKPATTTALTAPYPAPEPPPTRRPQLPPTGHCGRATWQAGRPAAWPP